MTAFRRTAFLLRHKASGGFWFLALLIVLLVSAPCSADPFSGNPVSRIVPSSLTSEPEKAPLEERGSQPRQEALRLSAVDSGGVETWEPSAYYVQSLTFEPENPVAGDPIKVDVHFKEFVQQPLPLLFHWKVNGEAVSETTNPVFQYATKRGDRVEVDVSVGGNRGEAHPVQGTVTVENTPPTVKKLDEVADEKGEYTAHLQSSDADGDAVTLTLQKGPDGMTLDESTGELHWSIPKGTEGDFPVEVMARDSYGGEVIFSYTLTVK
jgi:hypothetical protein